MIVAWLFETLKKRSGLVFSATIAAVAGTFVHSFLVLSGIYLAFNGNEVVGGNYTMFLVAWGGLNAIIEDSSSSDHLGCGNSAAYQGQQGKAGLIFKKNMETQMVFVLDVGNSNIKCGLFKDGKILNSWRMKTDLDRTADEYGIHIMAFFRHGNHKADDVAGIMISSVIPSINYTLQHMCSTYFNKAAMFVSPGIRPASISGTTTRRNWAPTG